MKKLHRKKLVAAVSVFASAAFALASPSAHAVTEICFDNANRGGNMSFYLYPAKDYKRSSTRKIWENGHNSYFAPRRCVSAAELINANKAKWNDHVIGYYTAEGKIGPAHFACPHMLQLTKSPIKRAVMTITGSTIYNTKCKQQDEHKGRFLHPTHPFSEIDAGVICFDNANHGLRANYYVHDTRRYQGYWIWQETGQHSVAAERCVKVAELQHTHPLRSDRWQGRVSPDGDSSLTDCAKFKANPKSDTIVQFVATGTTYHNIGCRRANYVHVK